MAERCPKCLRLSKTQPQKTPGWCRVCRRWQFFYQATFVEFAAAVYKHLACVKCGTGAWCRDMQMRDGSERCAYEAHVEPFELHAPKA